MASSGDRITREDYPLPRYHHPDHLEVYSTEAVKGPENDAAFLFEMVEEVLYPDAADQMRPTTVSSDPEKYEAQFDFSFVPYDAMIAPWAHERVDLSVNHVKFFGRAALKQVLDIKVHNVIIKRNDIDDVITNEFYFEQLAGDPYTYVASIRRSDITNRENVRFEDMTAYDCGILFDTVRELQGVLAPVFGKRSW